MTGLKTVLYYTFCLTLYFVIFHIYYTHVEMLRNEYLGREDLSELLLINVYVYFSESFFLALLLVVLPYIEKIVFTIFLLFLFIPYVVLNNNLSTIITLYLLVAVFAFVLKLKFFNNVNGFSLNNFYWIGVSVCIISSLLSIQLYGFNLNIDVNNVYEYRLENSGKGVNSVAGYLYTITMYLFGPYVLFEAMKQRRPIGVFIGFFSLLICFYTNASKISLFIIVISLILPKVNLSNILRYIYLFFIFSYILGMFVFDPEGLDLINFFVGRLLVLPSISSTNYVDFANAHHYFWFQDWNFIGEFFKNNFNIHHYTLGKTFEMGKFYSLWDGNNYNSTLFANAYLDGGIFIVLVFTIFIALVFKGLITLMKFNQSILIYIFILCLLSMEKSLNGILIGGGLIVFPLIMLFNLIKRA